LDEQRDFFNEKKVEVEAARRLLVPATKQEVGNENQQDNPEEARLDVHNETEEGDGNEEKEGFYDTKEDDVKAARFLVSPASVGLLLFIAVIVGLVVTWYARKLQRKRSGLHKKLDVAAVYSHV
jgi:hypothetical protein